MGSDHVPVRSGIILSALLFAPFLFLSSIAQADSTSDGAADSQSPAVSSSTNGSPTEVTVKGQESSSRITSQKPPINITVDPFESIRSSLKPDQSLLLAMSPLMASWQKTHPEFLMDSRVIQPWRNTFGEKPGVIFPVRKELRETLSKRISNRQAESYAWTLTIADDQGRVFRKYEGSKKPPEEIVWSGEGQGGQWVKAGESYSAIYTFNDPQGSPHTIVGKPIVLKATVHQNPDGLHLALSSAIIFGPRKSETKIQKPDGLNLLRASADFIKRFYPRSSLRVRLFSETSELGNVQAQQIENYLRKELMLPPQNISFEAAEAPFSDQRILIIVLNH